MDDRKPSAQLNQISVLRKEDLVIFLQYERLIREASQFDRGNGSLEAEPEADVHTNGKDLKKKE